MRWTAPLDRREISIVLFSLTIFTLSYNLDNSFRLLGLDPVATQGTIFGKLGFGGSSAIGKDGRKPSGWRDSLENKIFGDWGWDEGHVAGDGAERSQLKGTGRYGAMWLGRKETGILGGKTFGNTTANDALDWWGDEMPITTLIKHVPGYTILDNVIIFNGSVSIVTDSPETFPPLELITSSDEQWEILSSAQARSKIGQYGGRLRDVTWISTDIHEHNSTLLSLWRTYSSLDPSIDSEGRTTLPLPRRLFFSNIPIFSDPDPPHHFYLIPRVRSDTGFHPFLPKAIFPTMGVMYQEDWEDFHLMEVPYLMERVVLADRRSAATTMHMGQPVFSPPFEMEASEYWWEPVRRALAVWFNEHEDGGKQMNGKRVVTYLHKQGERSGPRVREADHEALVTALKRMQKEYGYKVNIVSSMDEETGWNQRMKAVVGSTIVLGVHGNNLLESIFIKPSPHATVMEFFPPDMFSRDLEMPTYALGLQYMAWWDDQHFSNDSLPVVARPNDQEVPINAQAVVEAIREIFDRH